MSVYCVVIFEKCFGLKSDNQALLFSSFLFRPTKSLFQTVPRHMETRDLQKHSLPKTSSIVEEAP